MVQNSESKHSDRPSPHPGILPANLDDPRFADQTRSAEPVEWAAGSACVADLMEPVDEARTAATSPVGIAALVESGLQLVLEALGSLLSTVLSHWGH